MTTKLLLVLHQILVTGAQPAGPVPYPVVVPRTQPAAATSTAPSDTVPLWQQLQVIRQAPDEPRKKVLRFMELWRTINYSSPDPLIEACWFADEATAGDIMDTVEKVMASGASPRVWSTFFHYGDGGAMHLSTVVSDPSRLWRMTVESGYLMQTAQLAGDFRLKEKVILDGLRRDCMIREIGSLRLLLSRESVPELRAILKSRANANPSSRVAICVAGTLADFGDTAIIPEIKALDKNPLLAEADKSFCGVCIEKLTHQNKPSALFETLEKSNDGWVMSYTLDRLLWLKQSKSAIRGHLQKNPTSRVFMGAADKALRMLEKVENRTLLAAKFVSDSSISVLGPEELDKYAEQWKAAPEGVRMQMRIKYSLGALWHSAPE